MRNTRRNQLPLFTYVFPGEEAVADTSLYSAKLKYVRTSRKYHNGPLKDLRQTATDYDFAGSGNLTDVSAWFSWYTKASQKVHQKLMDA